MWYNPRMKTTEILNEMESKQISKYRLAKELGLTVQAVQNWFKREVIPKKHKEEVKKILSNR